MIEKPTEKAAKQDAVQSWREKREANRKAAEAEQAEPQSKSWREKLAEKQKEEEEKQIADKKAAEAAAKTAAADASTAPAGRQQAPTNTCTKRTYVAEHPAPINLFVVRVWWTIPFCSACAAFG